MRQVFALAAFVSTLLASSAQATLFTTYITGEAEGLDDVIFKAVIDPTNVTPISVTPIILTDRRVDGIDYVPGTGSTEVAVGATAESIPHYDVALGVQILPDFIPSTGTVPGGPGFGSTRPSTIKTTPDHFYYTENQFGFNPLGPSPHHANVDDQERDAFRNRRLRRCRRYGPRTGQPRRH